MSKTRNALIAGSAVGTATAIATPGAIGVVAAGKACKIPVVTQVVTMGALAALGAAALTGNAGARRRFAVGVSIACL